MNSIPTQVEFGLKDALNSGGVLLKKKVRSVLEGIKDVEIIGEEYPMSYTDRTSIDLVVAVKTDMCTYIIPIECKRAYVKQKRWVFFPAKDHNSKFLYKFTDADLTVTETLAIEHLDLTICSDGIEVDSKKKYEKAYKMNSDPVFKAASQICEGCLGFVKEELDQRKKYPKDPKKNFVVFPVVVTTASLSILNDSPADVDLASGNLVSEPNLESAEAVILKHPFASTKVFGTQFLQVIISHYVVPNLRGLHNSESVVVVNAANLQSFIEKLHNWVIKY